MNVVIIVAAGKGTRMGNDKLWLDINGCPVIGHSWRLFEQVEEVDSVIIVAREERHKDIDELGKRIGIHKPYEVVLGGAERQDSVWNGLEACPAECEIVAIHDAARPCAHPDLVRSCFENAVKCGAVVAGQRITDTIKRVDTSGTIQSTIDREGVWSVQTPQVFQFKTIRKALQIVRESGETVTDDTAACERIGAQVKVVSSDHPNPKVTFPKDLPYVGWLLANHPLGN